MGEKRGFGVTAQFAFDSRKMGAGSAFISKAKGREFTQMRKEQVRIE